MDCNQFREKGKISKTNQKEMNPMSALIKCLVGCLLSISPVVASNKMYIDLEELYTSGDQLHIHMGHNVWIQTKTLCRDKQGGYALKKDIVLGSLDKRFEYEKHWKCPYCFHHWPWGTQCQNPECPSKF